MLGIGTGHIPSGEREIGLLQTMRKTKKERKKGGEYSLSGIYFSSMLAIFEGCVNEHKIVSKVGEEICVYV